MHGAAFTPPRRSVAHLGRAPSVSCTGVRRSQNGFDNSGHTANVTWAADGQSFTHWPTRSAGWQGAFDPYTMTYLAISWNNIRTTVQANLLMGPAEV